MILKRLSARKLDKSLEGFLDRCASDENKKRQAAEDMAAVLEYSYANTIDKSSGRDKLRVLLARHAAYGVRQLWDCTAFQRALEGSGELARDIIGELMEKVPNNPQHPLLNISPSQVST